MMSITTKKAVRHSRKFRYLIVDITKDTTTLYASDRDVFLFLVDDTHPIEAGRLADGSPDLYFRASSTVTRKLDRRPSASLRFISGRCA